MNSQSHRVTIITCSKCTLPDQWRLFARICVIAKGQIASVCVKDAIVSIYDV